MRTNVAKKATPIFTHEGGPAIHQSAEKQLRRTVMTCMLFEDNFYEDGQSVADRIGALVPKVPFDKLAEIAIEAREKQKLRHVPLLIARHALKHFNGRKVGDMIARIIQRPDECGELLSLYWKDGPEQPLASQLKLGLARAIQKFDAYQLAKYDRDAGVKLRDVIFLTHPRPRNEDVARNFAKLVNKDHIPAEIAGQYGLDPKDVGLASPDTWEVKLAEKGQARAALKKEGMDAAELEKRAKEDKRATFETMIAERKLGAMALLRNLRGMVEAGVPERVIREGIATMKADRVLPFRFLSAARYAMRFEPELEVAMFRCLEGATPMQGKTAILVDTSYSMYAGISGKSELSRVDAAAALAVLVREIAADVRVFVFTDSFVEVPARRGFALRDSIIQALPRGGTSLGMAVNAVGKIGGFDRLIVVTDEQSADRVDAPKGIGRNYMINVASYQNGVGYGEWVRIDGWSEAVVDYIQALEAEEGKEAA